MPQYEATLTYTRELLLKAMNARFVKQQWKRISLVILAIIAAFLTWRHINANNQDARLGLVFFALFVANLFCLFLLIYHYFSIRHLTIKKFESTQSPLVKMMVNDESFSVSDETGHSTIYWKQFTDFWRQADFCVVYLQKKPLTIPTRGLSKEVIDFIEGKIKTKPPKTS
jgi:phosphoglycerol transferase MdoB-like AlkP superfamily enzyme